MGRFVLGLIAMLLAVGWFVPCPATGAQPPGPAYDSPEPQGWLTGPALHRRLTVSVNIVWGGNPLRQALRGLSETQHLAVLIDRRVDPGQRIDLQLSSVPLADALREIAKSRGLGISQFGPVAYFGPPAAAARLRTLAALAEAEVRPLPVDAARKFLRLKPLAWENFATPRDLLGQLAEEGGLELAGLQRVPHDLWAAADLPPLSLVDRMVLVANQFDLTLQVAGDGSQVRLVPVPDDVSLTRSYSGARNTEQTAKDFAALAPHAKVRVAEGKVWVRGLLEDHERIAPPRPPAEPAGKQRIVGPPETRIERLEVQEKPVGPVLEQLAARLDFELRMDRKAIADAGISLDQRVSVHLQRATLDDVLRELLKNTRLTYQRKGNVVEVMPR